MREELATHLLPANQLHTQCRSLLSWPDKSRFAWSRKRGEFKLPQEVATPGLRVERHSFQFDADGLPKQWTISGTTTFGSKVAESFSRSGRRANWTDSTGKGSAKVDGPAVYVPQGGSPWSDQVYARALLKRPDMSLPALPGGTLRGG